MKITIKKLAAAVIGGLIVPTSSALAAETALPQTIRIVVPYSSGTGIDLVARGVAERIATQTGSHVIVENREGAGGSIGTAAVAKASAHGSVLLFNANPPFTTAPAVQGNDAYKPLDDFAPIARVALAPSVLVGNNDAAFKSFDELVKYARDNPGKVDYATNGMGTSSHLGLEVVSQMAGLQMVPIHYRSVTQALTDTIGGQVPLYLPTYASARAQIDAGNVKALAIGTKQRSPLTPDTPTLSELLQRPDLELGVWYGLLAPKNIPADVADRLSDEIVKAGQSQPFIDTLAKMGISPSVVPREQFTRQVEADYQEGVALLKQLGIGKGS